MKIHFKMILFPEDMGEAVYLLLSISPIAKVSHVKWILQVGESAD